MSTLMVRAAFKVERTCRNSIRKVRSTTELCATGEQLTLEYVEENKVTMTYKIEWTPSDTRWASRYVAFKDMRLILRFVASLVDGTPIWQ